jgi:hypothetical protein
MPLRERQEVEEMSRAAGVDFSRARCTHQCNAERYNQRAVKTLCCRMFLKYRPSSKWRGSRSVLWRSLSPAGSVEVASQSVMQSFEDCCPNSRRPKWGPPSEVLQNFIARLQSSQRPKTGRAKRLGSATKR